MKRDDFRPTAADLRALLRAGCRLDEIARALEENPGEAFADALRALGEAAAG